MKLKCLVLFVISLLYYINCNAIPGCQIGTGVLSRVYYNTTLACSGCSAGEYWTNNGNSNYIVFDNSGSQCNLSQYNSTSTEYVKNGELTPRTISGSCYITNAVSGGSGTRQLGTPVSFLRKYNCPLDDYIWLLILPLGVFGVYYMRKRSILARN